MTIPEDGLFSAVGKTPLIRLRRALGDLPFRLFAKLEGLNPGGSIKDRPALAIIRDGIERGLITRDTVIVESSSGNLAIGLAQVCRFLGLRLICVIDIKAGAHARGILRAYGAEIELVSEPDASTGEFLPARLARVQEILRRNSKAFWPNQYANPSNSGIHRCQTMPEIVADLGRNIDYLFCTISTCGTVTGCAEYVLECGLKTHIVAVDAVGSVIFGGEARKRLIPGHGAGIRPELCRPDLIHSCLKVTDRGCILGCRRLLSREAILAGGSSGAVLTAVARFRDEIPPQSTCVIILPDRGERYLETIYSDSWIAEHFGTIPDHEAETETEIAWTTANSL